MTTETGRISVTAITFKLNRNNHYEWSKQLEGHLKGEKIWHHIKHEDFAAWRLSKWKPSSITEKRYWLSKSLILDKPDTVADVANRVAAYGETEREDELLALEVSNLYKDSFKSFESERIKSENDWDSTQERIYGILAACVDRSIWVDVQCQKTVKGAWDLLGRSCGQNTTAWYLAKLKGFFDIQMKQNESLPTFAGKVQESNNAIRDLGVPGMEFNEIQIIAKIMSAVPHNAGFTAIQQQIHNLKGADLTLEKVKDILRGEEKRIECNRESSNQDRDSKKNANANANAIVPEKKRGQQQQPQQRQQQQQQSKGRKCVTPTCREHYRCLSSCSSRAMC